MKNRLLVPAMALAFCGSCDSGNVPEKDQRNEATDEVEAITVIAENLKDKLFAELVPDSVIEKVIDSFFAHFEMTNDLFNVRTFWAQEMRKREEQPCDYCETNVSGYLNALARQNVLESELCPAFGDFNERCWDALYAAYSGGEWFAQHYGMPVETLPILEEARARILEIARTHLADPENLLQFFASKKDVIVKALRKHVHNQQEAEILDRWMQKIEQALEVFHTPDFQKTYHVYLSDEDESKAANKRLSEKMTPEMDKKGYASPDDYPTEVHAVMAAYYAREETDKVLRAMTPDLGTSLFAGRRHAEGGSELVDAWTAVVEETRDLVKGLFQL